MNETMTMEQILAFHFKPKPAGWKPPKRVPFDGHCPCCGRTFTEGSDPWEILRTRGECVYCNRKTR